MSSSINFSFSSHNVSRSSRRVVFDLGGDGDFAGKADEDIFELLENFKSMDRLVFKIIHPFYTEYILSVSVSIFI